MPQMFSSKDKILNLYLQICRHDLLKNNKRDIHIDLDYIQMKLLTGLR